MELALLAMKNALRHKGRTMMTIMGVAVCVIAFMALRTVLTAWDVAAEHSMKDRLCTRHKVSFVLTLPKRYVDEIRKVPGVRAATFATWFGGKHPQREHEFFATYAVDSASWFRVYDDMHVAPAQLEAWQADRKGAIIGDMLAKKFGWKIGDTVRLRGTTYPGTWEFTVRGIYSARSKVVDRSSFVFHWDYLNASVRPEQRERVGWFNMRIDDPSKSAAVSRAIDRRFEDYEDQTASMTEHDFNASMLGMVSAVLSAVDVVSLVILGIMGLVLGNTIAMGVRERTHEYGVLAALGFAPRQIAGFVVWEGIAVGVLGGLLGVALGYPLVNDGLGRALEENAGSFFPYFRVETGTLALAVAICALLGLLAAALPAYRATRLEVTDALRRVG